MGDPAGVGPELCLRLLAEESVQHICHPIIFGDCALLRRVASEVSLPLHAPTISARDWPTVSPTLTGPAVLDLPMAGVDSVTAGQLSATGGAASYHYVMAAIDAGLRGQIQAVTTAPLNKEALHLAGHHFPGHTEIFAQRMQATRSCMMQYSEAVTCSFVTVHVGYAEVPALLRPERILEVIELTAEALERIRRRVPRLLVCGLNPHAGEKGLFGQREEERFIAPAVAAARQRGLDVTGPVPPDTAFTPDRRRDFDAVVCMYHDQGHIPVKMIAFDSAVNTTLGLPVIRTSVDHGTAFDIAWQGRANPGSLFAAVRLAALLSATS